MYPHALNKAHPTKDGRLIMTKAIRIKDSGCVALFKSSTPRRKDDPRELARLKKEARELLASIEREEALAGARAVLQAI